MIDDERAVAHGAPLEADHVAIMADGAAADFDCFVSFGDGLPSIGSEIAIGVLRVYGFLANYTPRE